jgi:branched-chain amino acid transport system substrate-binding protein
MASAFAASSIDLLTSGLAPLWQMSPQALKLGILHEDGLYGTSVSGFQATSCKDLGLNVVERLSYAASTADLSSAVQRLRGASADLVLHTGYPNDVVLFFRQMKQAGWLPRMVVGAGGGYSLTDTASAAGPEFEGAVTVDFPPYATSEAAAPGARDVQGAYEKKYGAKPRSGHSLANYVGAKLFLDAVNRAGALNQDRIRAAILSTDVPPGSLPNGWGAKFDDKGQNLRAKPVVSQWQGGVLRTVLPLEAAVATLRPTLGG